MINNKSDSTIIIYSFLSGACTAFAAAWFYSRKSKCSKAVLDSTSRREVDQPEVFCEAGLYLLDWVVEYRKKCRMLPVVSVVQHNYLKKLLPKEAPENSESWRTIFKDLDSTIVPGLTNWQASNKFCIFSSYPAVLAEMLCAGLNVMGFDWIASPACTELEVITLDWLASILNLPDKFKSTTTALGVLLFKVLPAQLWCYLLHALGKMLMKKKLPNKLQIHRENGGVRKRSNPYHNKESVSHFGLTLCRSPSEKGNDWAVDVADIETELLLR